MIASYLHNFIFIKTKKTAGTAVETVLATVCGPEDIITPLGLRDEVARVGSEPVCRNFSSDPKAEALLRTALLAGERPGVRAVKAASRKADFYNHMPVSEIKARIAPDFWAGAYKFTVERHPYEKAVSQAYHKFKHDGPFETFLDTVLRKGGYSSYDLYTLNGEVVVDHFLRQENLEQDLRSIGAHLNLHLPEEIPKRKSSSRGDRRPAREILNDAQKEIVYGFCRKEFELLGYER